MKRREFLAATLGATALATLPNDANAQEKSDDWNEGEVHHLLPTANHNRVLIKASFKTPLSRAPKLRMGSNLATMIQTDTLGYFWAFDTHDLDPDTEYECTLTDNGGRSLCDTWPLKTFPHPDESSEHLRLLIYTCAGGHDGLATPGGSSFVPIPHRRKLLQRALSFSPDAVVSIGDHVYWDLIAGKSPALLGASPQAKALAGEFDRTLPVLGTKNEDVLKKAVGPQVADLYGTLFRSTPVFFYQDDHDYFENDHADDEIITFPPDAFMLRSGRASQWLYYPEFLPDQHRPLGLDGSSAGDRPAGLSEAYGTLRYGTLFEGMLYDCVRHLSLKGPSATFVAPTAEDWLHNRMRESNARHVANLPSSPIGWTAGKWAEWYPDVLTNEGKLTREVEKPYWQSGWRAQHDRLLRSASSMDRVPLFISGDIHAIGETHIQSYDNESYDKNPVVSVLSGPLGTSQRGWPSTFRGITAQPPKGMVVDEKLPTQEKHGFILADFTPDTITLSYFRWNREDGPGVIDKLTPFRTTTLNTQA